MNGEAVHQAERQSLFSRLLDAVKECQVRFGGKGELASETDSRVSILCNAWENCLRHGVRPSNKALNALKHVTELTGLSKLKGGIFSDIRDIETEPVFWHAVREILSKHELNRFLLLKHVTTDSGRARAWLRSSLNEKTLERQLLALLENTKLLNQYYEDWALLRDQERTSLLPNMASGLASVLFAITIDTTDLNRSMAQSNLTRSNSAATVTSNGLSRLLPNSLLASFQRSPDTTPVLAGTDAIEIPSNQMRTSKKRNAKIVSFDNAENDSDLSESEGQTYYEGGLQRHSSKVSILSGGSGGSCDEDQIVGSSFTPLNANGLPVPISTDEDDQSVDSDIPILSSSWTEDAVTALSLAARVQRPSTPRRQDDKGALPDEKLKSAEAMTADELKQAIVVIMMKKEELEEQNGQYRVSLSHEQEYNKSLKAELTELTKKMEEQTARDHAKIQSLTKDSELLKHQLKKYVNAVQMLRKDGPNAENLGIHLDEPQPVITPSRLQSDVGKEASEYRKKLVQVAEMHGELMEFNEHLCKVLINREACIRKLTQELTDLRGPLPSEVHSTLSDDVVMVESEWKPLVNIWLPSVFLKGSASKAHHVYQVFFRIKDEEWNVYRRYSDLYSFYSKAKRKYPIVVSFDFPPKKAMGNKGSRFVEERRKKLQSFLRRAVQYILSVETELKDTLCRTNFTQLFPNFGDTQDTGKKRQPKRPLTSSPAAIGSPSHYTGL